ncbi:MAG TPA: HAMP domain-containing sensor histidine kinase, partial [Candidatus Dormibacteraeota bacterium]|nr:HAMP domain-containing sensor histidine kinase [Candidatus Dormibacteraeota bacterium]
CKLEDGQLVIEEVLDIEGAPVQSPHTRIPISAAMREALNMADPTEADYMELVELFPIRKGMVADDGPGTGLILPLSLAGEQIGLLNVVRRSQAPFTEDQIQGVRQLTAVAALLLQTGRLLQEARQGEDAKREFLNLAGHELRTPLTVLKGYFSLLENGTFGAAPDGWDHPMSAIKTELGTLERMVESLLVAARAEADQMRPSIRSIELVAEVQAAIRRAQPQIELDGALCSFQAPQERVAALGDPEHLGLVLDNLIHNALDYSAAPAHLHVEIEGGSEPKILIRDSGIGIPETDRDRVFERFVRLAPTVMPTKSGSGLGLFISRGLARGMGGDVVIVDSEPGKGTTMAVKLRMSEPGAVGDL